jgi:hypothetical protein
MSTEDAIEILVSTNQKVSITVRRRAIPSDTWTVVGSGPVTRRMTGSVRDGRVIVGSKKHRTLEELKTWLDKLEIL